jgi:hypothetical protein
MPTSGQTNYANFREFKNAKDQNAKDKKTPPKVVEAWLPRPSNFPNLNLENVNVWGRPDGKNPDEWFKHDQIGPFTPGWTKINPLTLKPK